MSDGGREAPASAGSVDDDLIKYLGEELLSLLLAPPRVPSFAAETVRPPAKAVAA